MMRKTDVVMAHIHAGRFKDALRIAKDFRIGVTSDDRLAMSLAYECIVHPDFYRSLGFNLHSKKEEGVNRLIQLFTTAN